MKLKSIIALKYVPIREWTRIRIILVVFLTLICHSNAFCAQDSINAQQLYKQYANLPTDKLYRKGHALLTDNKLDDAMVCFTIVAGRYNTGMSSEEKRICAYALNNAGAICQIHSNYSLAFSYYKKAMQIAEQPVYQSYNNIAGIYLFYNDYAHAKEYLEKAFDFSLEQKDWNSLQNSLQNLLFLYWRTEKLDSIDNWVKRFSEAEGQEKDSLYRSTMAVVHGMQALRQGHYDEAISLFQKFKEKEGFADANNSSVYIASAYQRMQNYAEALRWLKKAEIETRASGAMYMLMLIYELQTEYLFQMGKLEASREAKFQYMSLKDSINTADELEKIKNTEFFHEIDKYARQVETLNQQKHTRSLVAIVSVVSLLFVLLALAYAIKKNKDLVASNKDLYRMNDELVKRADSEKQLRTNYTHKLTARQNEIDSLKETISRLQKDDQMGSEPSSETSEQNEKSQEKLLSDNDDEELNQLMEKVYGLLDDVNFIAQQDLTVERVAQAIGVHERYVSQAINDTMHKNFNTVLNEYRIREACKRLTDFEHYGAMTNETIAEGLGYKSRSHFTRTFKKITGLTPSQYQHLALEKPPVGGSVS